jgi:hypothetical protein
MQHPIYACLAAIADKIGNDTLSLADIIAHAETCGAYRDSRGILRVHGLRRNHLFDCGQISRLPRYLEFLRDERGRITHIHVNRN